MAQNTLLDFLQGASNSAASNVSAPIDGLNWLLRKAGMPVSDKPFLGSDWMAQKGLTVQPQNKMAGLLGESFGGVAPIVAAAKAPQIARGLLQAGDNLAAPTALKSQAGAIWNGDVKVNFKPESKWLSASTENGLVGGHVRDDGLHINYAQLEEVAQGKGEGSAMYRALIDDALKKGMRVFSDRTVAEPAVRVYESLRKHGYDVKRLGGGLLDDGSVYGEDVAKPAFEVLRGAKYR